MQKDNRMNHKNRKHIVKISETNKILRKYRNSALTYDLIRKIVYDMSESTIVPMKNNDIRILYE